MRQPAVFFGHGSPMNALGGPYGATTITGGDGSRMPSEIELDGARFQGKHIAELAKKLHG